MNLRRRLERLEESVPNLSKKAKYRLCKDMEWSELLGLVDEALAAGGADNSLMEKIIAFVDERAAIPKRDYCDGKNGELVFDEQGNQVFEHHFFVSWLWGLQAGSWSLPASLPQSFLEGFCSSHGMVMWRCEDCLCGLGNGSRYETCPICFSKNLSHKKLSGPPWDPDFVYTPLLIKGKMAR